MGYVLHLFFFLLSMDVLLVFFVFFFLDVLLGGFHGFPIVNSGTRNFGHRTIFEGWFFLCYCPRTEISRACDSTLFCFRNNFHSVLYFKVATDSIFAPTVQ